MSKTKVKRCPDCVHKTISGYHQKKYHHRLNIAYIWKGFCGAHGSYQKIGYFCTNCGTFYYDVKHKEEKK